MVVSWYLIVVNTVFVMVFVMVFAMVNLRGHASVLAILRW
jgi:hypothetical protein